MQVMVALLDMLKKGPAVEPTKWTASLLSTLCWQENSMKQVMIELRAPSVRPPERSLHCTATQCPQGGQRWRCRQV
jgi:hypothetical protein